MKSFAFGALALSLAIAAPAFAAAPKDCSVGSIAATPAKGTVGGKPFVVKEAELNETPNGMGLDNAKFDKYDLSLEHDGIFNAATVTFLVKLNTKPDGRTFRVLPTDSISAQPAAAEGLPEVQAWDLQLEAAGVDTGFTQDIASIRLELGQRKNGMMPGRIHFCVPSSKSEIEGSFEAKIMP